MTISSTTNRWAYTGDASSTAFAYTNKIFAAGDLRVLVDGVLQTLTTHYAVSGVGAAGGGNVTFVTAPGSGASVVIVRELTYTQETNLLDSGPFPAESTEDALDRAVILAQQLQDGLARTLRQPDADTAAIATMPAKASRASLLLGFDANGDPIATDGTALGGVLVSGFMATVLDDADAAAARATLGAASSAAATASAAGLVELATQPEVDAGTDDARAVTPAKLAAATTVGRTIIGAARSLVGAWVGSSTATFTADEVVLKTAGGAVYLASGVNVTVNIATSGANGLDTGAEASGTWYYVWLIYNGTTVAGLLSTSASAPTLPSGYTYRALVGAIRNDGSSNFIRFWQYGRRIAIATQNIYNNLAGVTSYTSQAISAAVPAIARFVSGSCGCSVSTGGWVTALAGDANGVGAQYVGAGAGSVAVDAYFGSGSYHDIPLITAQAVYVKHRNTSSENRLDVSGFVI